MRRRWISYRTRRIVSLTGFFGSLFGIVICGKLFGPQTIGVIISCVGVYAGGLSYVFSLADTTREE